MINIHRFPVEPTRAAFDSEEDYLFALDNWDLLVLTAEDAAMERGREREENNDNQ